MPIYKCPNCGRKVSLPEGAYYCKSCGPDYSLVRVRSRAEWESIADSIVREVYNEVHYWCWNISPEPVSECFYTHANEDLYTLASIYIREGADEKLKLLDEMPKDIYDKYNRKLQRMLEKTAKEIERKYGKPEEELEESI